MVKIEPRRLERRSRYSQEPITAHHFDGVGHEEDPSIEVGFLDVLPHRSAELTPHEARRLAAALIELADNLPRSRL